MHLAGLLTHPTYVFVLVAYAAASVIVSRTAFSGATVAAAAAVAVYALAWGRVFLETVRINATSWMMPPRLADIQASYLQLWGTGPGFILIGALLVLALGRRAQLRTALATDAVRWVAYAAVIGWLVPIAVSFSKPVFAAARTPVMLLPVTTVILASLIALLAERAVLAALAIVLLLASAQVLTARPTDPFPTADSLRTVLARAKCGDTILATGLANDPLTYYLRRVGAPPCVGAERFPVSMANWTGRIKKPETLEQVNEEASRLVSALAHKGGTVWTFGLSRGMGADTFTLLRSHLEQALRCDVRLPLRGAFFDTVLVCQAPQVSSFLPSRR